MLDVRCLTSIQVGMTKKRLPTAFDPPEVDGCHVGSKARRNVFR